jgi:hypothetical protein
MDGGGSRDKGSIEWSPVIASKFWKSRKRSAYFLSKEDVERMPPLNTPGGQGMDGRLHLKKSVAWI